MRCYFVNYHNRKASLIVRYAGMEKIVLKTKTRRFNRSSNLFSLVLATAMFVLGTTAWALATPIPEMDPGTASSGLVLAGGVLVLLREIYRKR
jgi:hypothetical protein